MNTPNHADREHAGREGVALTEEERRLGTRDEIDVRWYLEADVERILAARLAAQPVPEVWHETPGDVVYPEPKWESVPAASAADLSATIRDYLTDETDVTRPGYHATALTHRILGGLAS